MIRFLLVLIVFCFVGKLQSQITLIPDPEFEWLLVFQGIDTDGVINGQVATSDIEDELILLLDHPQIQDLTGLEDFASLEELKLLGVNVSEVNLSQNSNLELFEVNTAPLESLDLSQNLNLRKLVFVGGHNCASCPFSSPITSLDLSNNLLIEDIIIAYSLIGLMDFSMNVLLDRVQFLYNTDLTSVNLKNGNNENIYYLVINDNPSLACIQVDDPAAVIAGVDPPYDNWTISGNPLISEDCFLGLYEVNLKSSVVIYPNPVKDQLYIDLQGLPLDNLKIYTSQGQLVHSATQSNEIDVSRLPAGLYYIQITSQEQSISKKFIKE